MRWPQPIPAPRKGEPEVDIERYVTDKVLAWWGIPSLKLNVRGRNGWPDRVYWLPERPVLIEFKRLGEEARALQTDIHAMLRKLGYEVYVCDDREQALTYVHTALAKTSLGRKLLQRSLNRAAK